MCRVHSEFGGSPLAFRNYSLPDAPLVALDICIVIIPEQDVNFATVHRRNCIDIRSPITARHDIFERPCPLLSTVTQLPSELFAGAPPPSMAIILKALSTGLSILFVASSRNPANAG